MTDIVGLYEHSQGARALSHQWTDYIWRGMFNLSPSLTVKSLRAWFLDFFDHKVSLKDT